MAKDQNAGFTPATSAGYQINHAARLLAVGLAAELQPLGLAPAQFAALLHLWQQDGLSQRELVEKLAMEQATVANTLVRMERDGLIRRSANPSDERKQVITLTETARGLEAEAKSAAKRVNARALAGIAEEDVVKFLDVIQALIANLSVSRG